MLSNPTLDLVLLCDICHLPLIGAGDFLQVNEVAAHQLDHEKEEWEARHRTPGGGVTVNLSDRSDPPPGKVLWEVYHKDCDPHPDEEGYGIGAERCTNFAELLEWTAHLMEKRWIQNTNWSIKLRSILRDSGRPIDF